MVSVCSCECSITCLHCLLCDLVAEACMYALREGGKSVRMSRCVMKFRYLQSSLCNAKNKKLCIFFVVKYNCN